MELPSPKSAPSDRARVWGDRTDSEQRSWERNRRNLEQMERDDPLLIYRNSMSQYTATRRVGPIAHTKHVRDEYWDGGPALDVYVVCGTTFESIDVDGENVREFIRDELHVPEHR